MASKAPRSVVVLIARNAAGEIVEQVRISFDDYYEGSHPLVDSDKYRAGRGIHHVNGRIFGYEGNLLQTFDVQYGDDGVCLRSRAVHEDGTITGDEWEK